MKEQERCSDCGNSGAVKTGEDEYLTCPCINDNLKIETMTSYQNTIMDLLKGKTPKAKHDYLVALILDRDKFAIGLIEWLEMHEIGNETFEQRLDLYKQSLQLFHSQKQTQG